MIQSNGYKAFNGIMQIVPKSENLKPFEIEADWVYNPEYNCWYGKGRSFHNEICKIVKEN